MARHEWNKSMRTTWPLECASCGVEGRVKNGTAGTMQYRADSEAGWATRTIPCAPFPCCGGSDEAAPTHTRDCQLRTPMEAPPLT